MKFTCNKTAFAQTFNVAAATAAVNDIKNVFQNIKLKAENGHLIFMASDLDNSVRLQLDGVNVQEPGSTILPKDLLKEILQVCRDNEILVESRGNQLSLFDGRYCDIPTIDPDNFPDIELIEADEYHEITADTLRQLITRTKYATERENTKYALSGVLIEMTEGRFAGISTDSRRMTNQESTANQVGNLTTENESIVSLGTLDIAERIFSGEEKIRCVIREGRIHFLWGNSMLRGRLIQGRFPRWRNMFPTDDKIKDFVHVDFLAGPLTQLIREAKIPRTVNQPALLFQFSTGRLVLTAQGSERGQSLLSMPINYDAEPLDLKFEPTFILDFLKILNPETQVELYLNDNSAALFKTSDGYRYLVMPMS
ncbi:MAG: DNA polymerase III subunit beta [Thermoguttaceae bacterium]|nr:DNA polymerase III subunit beta [Thermoguttaceae bacterium]